MYLHKRVCAIITLRRMFEIAYVQNFISSPVIKQMILLIFFQNPLFIYKMHFLLSKTAWPASRCNCRSSNMLMLTSYWQVHCGHIFAKNLPLRYFPSDTYTFDCKYVSFCIALNTFIRLKIANSFLFLIFPVCFLYLMSQSTFHDQIRPRPLIACLNCAAQSFWMRL